MCIDEREVRARARSPQRAKGAAWMLREQAETVTDNSRIGAPVPPSRLRFLAGKGVLRYTRGWENGVA